MALSGHGKLVTLVPAAVVLMLLCAGAVQATCTYGQQYCSGSCVQPQTDANNCGKCGVKCIAAYAYSSCYKGECKYSCKPGYENCDGKWDNGCECEPQKDAENCGRCGAKCTAPANAWAKCEKGECKYSCKPGYENCDGKWDNGCECYPETDNENCGRCGAKCTAPANAWAKCEKGECKYSCKPGYENCDGKWDNGCECYPETDNENCGRCGAKCTAPANAWAKCEKGECKYSCKPGYENCDGKWDNGCECYPETDNENCGRCGAKCTAPANAWAKCEKGECKYSCKPGYENCDGKWDNGCECYPGTDNENCGRCGAKCTAPANAWAKCEKGSCEYSCKPGYENCDGKWDNGCECYPGTDNENCGRCGAKCTAPANAWAKCKMGSCEYSCKPGYDNCDGKWDNGCECEPEKDPKNCGKCGNKCEGGCTKGKCEKGKKGGDDDREKGKKGGDDDREKGKKGGDDDGGKGKEGGDGKY